MPRQTLALIAAVARNGVIGHDNQLLWRLPEDMKYFKRSTLGHPVIMGRKTWDSVPERFRPLPDRHNIVVTRQPGWQAAGATTTHSLDEALAAVQPDANRVFVIGGGELYAAAMPLADELLITEIDHPFEGDAHFPEWDRNAFVEVSREHHQAAAPNDFGFSFVVYRRR
ncbi:MAG: dihydrofolate reductase FolA [Pseudomonadota bacterium]|jgi:dihydrofolate reductase